MSADKPLPPETSERTRATDRETAVSLVIKGTSRATVASTFGISTSTLDKWTRKHRDGGNAALQDKRREQAPIRYASVRPVVESLSRQKRYRSMNITEAAVAIYQELHDPEYKIEHVPSISTIYNWIRRTPKKTKSNSTPYEKPTAAGQVDQLDGTKLECDVYDEDGKLLGRGTVIALTDAYVRYIKNAEFDLTGESVARIADTVTGGYFAKEDDPDWLSYPSDVLLVDNGSANRSKAVNEALVERAEKHVRLKFRAIGQPQSAGIVERTLQELERRVAEFGGKPTLADVKKIIREVCIELNNTVNSTLKTTPTLALAVSRYGSKNRPAVGNKLDPMSAEKREVFLLDLLRTIKTPQVRSCKIVFGNLTYRDERLDDLDKVKVAVKVSSASWRHFVYAYHPERKEYLKVFVDYNAWFPFTDHEVTEATNTARLLGKKAQQPDPHIDHQRTV